MEKSIRQRVQEQMDEAWRNMRVPTEEERDFAVANRNTNNIIQRVCCDVAKAWLRNVTVPQDDLRIINELMQKSKK